MDDCLFCKIIEGSIPSKTIYEDDIMKVFLDIQPSTNGDLLVVPKQHFVTFLDVEEEFLHHALQVTKEVLYPLLQEKLHCDGLTIVQNNFYGQDIKHFHIHLTPRYQNDALQHHFDKSLLKDLDTIYQTLSEK